MNPPSAGKLQQTQPTGPKVLMRMLARQLLQGLLLRFSQFNGTFHGQAGGQDEIASQTRHSEIRLLDTLISPTSLINRRLLGHTFSPSQNDHRASYEWSKRCHRAPSEKHDSG